MSDSAQTKTCQNCKHWEIMASHGSDRGDAGMRALNFRNCRSDNSQFAAMKFVHAEYFCEKFTQK